jgi:drug efflux transport system permease protein
MRVLLVFLQKEFLQVFRNRAMLPILFVMPIIQLLVLSFAATFDIGETDMVVVDLDGTPTARALVQEMQSSGYFRAIRWTPDPSVGDEALRGGDASLVVRIPLGFERDLLRSGTSGLALTLDATDGAGAGVIQAYATQIVRSFGVRTVLGQAPTGASAGARITPQPVFWYNPTLDYPLFMVPGILVVLVTMIGTFLSAMNVAREREIGTIDQLNVSPISKPVFILGKLFPFLIIALFDLAIGLIVARVVFGIASQGSLVLLFALAAEFLVVMLGFGLLISTKAETQQQAMFVAWFFIVIFMLMGGIFTPVESMPEWAQWVTQANPLTHFMRIVRAIMIRGASFADVARNAAALAVIGSVVLTTAVAAHRKVST